MNTDETQSPSAKPTRRRFIASSGLAVASGLSLARSAHAAGSDVIKIALIGCGGRGTGAAANALKTTAPVKLVAMADAFADRLETSHKLLVTQFKDRVDVPKDRRFVGLDACRRAIAADVDMVLLCTPPGFRPVQFETAVKAGKHVFMEKPVATDAPGVRKILAANEDAKKQGLVVAVGHHLRHEDKHRQLVQLIHDGAIGELQYMRAYFNTAGVWVRPRKPDQKEMEYQVHNWYYFTWLSGDHIVEQHVHDLDVCNWIKGDRPVTAQGMGGRQVRIGPEYGEIFDHHSVEFTYEDDTKLFSFCRHMPNCWQSFSQHAHGTKGSASVQGHGAASLMVDGKPPQRFQRGTVGHQVEHDDLFAALMKGRPYNEGDYGATSTMTAILGRMATYSGQLVRWDDAIASDLELVPERCTWDTAPPVKPGNDGLYPCAVPGVRRAL
jgi:myo-inositol 2-dehydrogenase/D-chiro-inositol 1-dehydrogenase